MARLDVLGGGAPTRRNSGIDRLRALALGLYPHEAGHVRWLIVAALTVALIGLGDVCLAQLAAPPRPAPVRPGLLLVNWVQPGTPGWESFPAIAAAFFAVGGIVFVVADEVLTGGIVLAFATSTAVMLLTALIAPFGEPWALALEFAALLGFGVGTFLVFLVFPINRFGVPSRRRFALAFLAGHGALFLAYLVAVGFAPEFQPAVQVAAFGALAVDLLGAGALAVRALAKPPPLTGQARFALGFIAIGLLLGVTPFCVLWLGPTLLGMGFIVRPNLAVLSMVCVPLSLGVAVLSRQFLGISRIVRRNLIALLVWGGLLATYGVVFDVLALRFGVTEGHPARWLGVMLLGIGLTVETFPLAQRRLRRGLERALFRDVYDYPETLHALGARIVRLAGLDEIARLVLGEVGTTLDVAWLGIEVGDEGITRERFTAGEFPPSAWASLESGPPANLDVFPLIADGVRIGSLVVGPKRRDDALRPEDARLLRALAHVLAPALRNAFLIRRLEQQVLTLEAREGELAALSAELLRVQEEERRRLALDLHDDPLQTATLLARELADRADLPETPRWHASVDEIVIALRSICMGLRPPFLDDFGLPGGLEWLVHDASARSNLVAHLAVQAPAGEPFGRLPVELETALFRIAQEALANCQKHARANQVTVTLTRAPGRVTLLIADDGRGAQRTPRQPDPSGEARSLGIVGMRERLRSFRGTVVVAARPEGGTLVKAEVLH
ncbi:MAG TPA: ATP-binding protein [Chloroflexota bacterium]|nr:ATP-binding protein [Chloroflexota bacterium]